MHEADVASQSADTIKLTFIEKLQVFPRAAYCVLDVVLGREICESHGGGVRLANRLAGLRK
jgi:hypothetical protein